MQIDVYDHGVFSWVDVTSKDFEASRKFYTDMFGWQIDPGPEEFGGYSMAIVNGHPVAGISPIMSPEAPSVWSNYVDVANVDETVAKALAAGGSTIVEPMDVADMGRMAMLSDPEGGVIGLWQAGVHKGAELVNEPNTWAWSELLCDDPDKMKAFYTGVFGWGAQTNGEGAGAYTEWQIGGRSIGGMMKKPEMMPPGTPTFWVVYIAVEDVDEATKKVESLGGAVFMPPMDIEPGRFSVVADPVGAVFHLFQQKAA
jgi:uncharacterized protein